MYIGDLICQVADKNRRISNTYTQFVNPIYYRIPEIYFFIGFYPQKLPTDVSHAEITFNCRNVVNI